MIIVLEYQDTYTDESGEFIDHFIEYESVDAYRRDLRAAIADAVNPTMFDQIVIFNQICVCKEDLVDLETGVELFNLWSLEEFLRLKVLSDAKPYFHRASFVEPIGNIEDLKGFGE